MPKSFRRMRISLQVLLTLVFFISLTGCMSNPDWGGHVEEFEIEHVKYAQMIRWGQFDKAATWITQESVEEFLKQAGEAETIRFTDYKIIRTDIKREDWTAQVMVRYEMHRVDELINQMITEKQSWKFNEEAERWELNTDLFEVLKPALDK